MARLDDIREWGKTRPEWQELVQDGKALPPGLTKAYRAYETGQEPSPVQVPDDERPPVEEVPPKMSEPTVVDKARELVGRARKSTPTAAKRTTGRKTFPRIPVDRLISRGWDALARVIQPVNMPVARVLATQAPVAGLILEDQVKNTIVDKLLQPLARSEQRAEVIIALVGPPLLVGALSKNPSMAPVLVPMLKEALKTWIDVAGPKMEEAMERNRKFQEEYGQQIDSLIEMFFMTEDVDTSPPVVVMNG